MASSSVCQTAAAAVGKEGRREKEKQEHARNPILPLSESSERSSSAAFVVSTIGMKERPELSSYLSGLL